MEQIRQSWQQMQAAVPDDTCLVIAFFPSKPQIYLPYLEPGDYGNIVDGQVRRAIFEPGQRIFKDNSLTLTYEDLISRLDNTRTVLRDEAEALGIPFVDLSPTFEEAAANGELLYYRYDTHWNQAGHDLAGAVIADFLADEPCTTAR
jgi:hypothetical protein